jgi:maltooligosyltrehalose trehalohydrolase
MLFMGEEYGETRPFPFFCSFGDAGLIEAVRRGRRAEFAAMVEKGDKSHSPEIPDPQAETTFQSAKLAWQWPDGSPQAGMRRLYAALLAARRRWPGLADRTHTAAKWDGVTLSIERGSGDNRIVAVANCTGEACEMPRVDVAGRTLLLSTAAADFGGPKTDIDASSPLLPYEMRLFGR